MLIKTAYRLAFMAFILSFFAKGQNRSFSFQHYGPEDGLSNTNVFSIKQNAQHIMHLATENGVYEFDGYKFEKIKPKTLKSNSIRNIGFNQENNLLIVTQREGIYEYFKKKNEATIIKQLKFNQATDELILKDQYAYSLNFQNSVSVINLKNGHKSDDEVKKKEKENRAFAIYKTSQQQILVGRSNGLYELKDGKQIKIDLIGNEPIYVITEDESGNIYMGSNNKILCMKDSVSVQTIPIQTQKTSNFFNTSGVTEINKLVVDKFNRIWFTNTPDDNLYLIENNILYDAFDLLGIDKVLINCLYKDADDHIWIGTFNDGVYFIQNPKFQNISFASNRKILTVLNAAFVNNHLLVGTNNGLFIYDRMNHQAQVVVSPDDLFNETIYGIYPYGNSVLYAKTGSINSQEKEFLIGKSFFHFKPLDSRLFSYSKNPSAAYLADRQGNLYQTIKQSLDKYNISDTLISFPDYRTKINALYESSNGLLIGTSDGLSRYSFSTKTYTSYNHLAFNFYVNHISSFNNKTYLAHENGITVLEDSTLIQQVGNYPLTTVKKIKSYQNKIWLATLDGLFICDLKFNPIFIYNKSNGLLSNTINDIVFQGSHCAICTDKGITICSLEDLLMNIKMPNRACITTIESNGKAIDFENNQLRLSPNQSDVTINFSSPLYAKPNKQFYRYRYNTRWFNLDNRQIHLTAIDGGNHQLDIICSYDGINWSVPTTIFIQKEIPFTQTIWFILTIILIGIILMITIVFIWVKRVRLKVMQRAQEDRQVNLLKHQAMNSLMSPHFIFNSLTSIQNYIHSNDSLKASEYLAKFSRLIRMIIEKASQSEITLHEELTRLNYYLDLEKERFKGKFDFKIEVDSDINTLEIKIPNMIIQPYVENSILHGILPKHEHGTLHIHFKKDTSKSLLIIIEDDGIGFNKAKQNAKAGHKSLGTKTIENILELNTKLTGKQQKVEIKDKSDVSETGRGTIITISLQI